MTPSHLFECTRGDEHLRGRNPLKVWVGSTALADVAVPHAQSATNDTTLVDVATGSVAAIAAPAQQVFAGHWVDAQPRKGTTTRTPVHDELMPGGRYDVNGETWTTRDHRTDPDVGTEGVYFANFSRYQIPKPDAADGCNWYDRYRAMLKRNAFGIIVLNEASKDLQRMMQEGEEEIPAAWNASEALVGNPRPAAPYAKNHRTSGYLGPCRKTDTRPERSFRCTLGHDDYNKKGDFTNAICVVDTHCAVYPEPGKGLRPPTVLANAYVDAPTARGGGKRYSRVTCFEVHLAKQVSHVGTSLRILVGHFHNEAAKRPKHNDFKRKYYEAVVAYIIEYRPVLFCCDANMALLETIDRVTECLMYRKSHGRALFDSKTVPRLSLAAWFPYHFVNGYDVTGSRNPTSGLGIDSLGMFVITYRDSPGADTALAETALYAGHEFIDVFGKGEQDEAWRQVVPKQDKFLRRFLPFGPNKSGTGYPGAPFDSYYMPPEKKDEGRLAFLESFLRPRTSKQELHRSTVATVQAYKIDMKKWDAAHDRARRIGDDGEVEVPAQPLCTHGFIRVKELRMDMREWVQDNGFFHQGTHMPLCVKFLGVSRRSDSALQQRKVRRKSRRESKFVPHSAIADGWKRRERRDPPNDLSRVNWKHYYYYEKTPGKHLGQHGGWENTAYHCTICRSTEHARHDCPCEYAAKEMWDADWKWREIYI